MRHLVIFGMTLLISGGCSLAPSDKFMEALGKDTANLCVKLNAVYGVGNGNVLYARANCVNCTVTCNQDGMTVRTDTKADVLSVPVVIQPTK